MVGDYREVAGRYLNLGNTYIKVKNYELAEKYLTVIAISNSISLCINKHTS